MSLSKHGIEQLAAKMANVGMSKILYFRSKDEDFRDAEMRAKGEYKKKRGGLQW